MHNIKNEASNWEISKGYTMRWRWHVIYKSHATDTELCNRLVPKLTVWECLQWSYSLKHHKHCCVVWYSRLFFKYTAPYKMHTSSPASLVVQLWLNYQMIYARLLPNSCENEFDEEYSDLLFSQVPAKELEIPAIANQDTDESNTRFGPAMTDKQVEEARQNAVPKNTIKEH